MKICIYEMQNDWMNEYKIGADSFSNLVRKSLQFLNCMYSSKKQVFFRQFHWNKIRTFKLLIAAIEFKTQKKKKTEKAFIAELVFGRRDFRLYIFYPSCSCFVRGTPPHFGENQFYVWVATPLFFLSESEWIFFFLTEWVTKVESLKKRYFIFAQIISRVSCQKRVLSKEKWRFWFFF